MFYRIQLLFRQSKKSKNVKFDFGGINNPNAPFKSTFGLFGKLNKMPRKNRKCKKKMNQLERGETASESKASRSGDQQLLQAKEIEKVATFLKLDDLVRGK